MRKRISVFGVAFVSLASVGASAAAPAASGPKLMESFKDWSVYSAGKGADRTCFAVSKPTETTPSNVKRDAVSFLISSWPAQKKKNEPSIVAGYPYKPMSKAVVEVG